MPQLLESVRAACDAPVITRWLPDQALKDWQAWATQQGSALQHASRMLRMARHLPRVFAGTRSLISLKRCSPTSEPDRRPDNENASLCSVLDVIQCPALSGYPTLKSVR